MKSTKEFGKTVETLSSVPPTHQEIEQDTSFVYDSFLGNFDQIEDQIQTEFKSETIEPKAEPVENQQQEPATLPTEQDQRDYAPDPQPDSAVLEAAFRTSTLASMAESLNQWGRTLVNLLQQMTDADQVIVLSRRPGKGTSALAVSGIDNHDSHASSIVELENLCHPRQIDEGLQPGQTLIWNDQEETATENSLSLLLGNYARRHGFQSAILVPLDSHAGSEESSCTVGGYVILFSADPVWDAKERLDFIHLVAPSLANQLRLFQNSEGSKLRQIARKIYRGILEDRRTMWTVLLSLACVTMLFPMPHQMHCEGTLQPTMRRYVAAPFAGKLQECFVKPGDVVKQGDLLAILDDRDVRSELDQANAELNREKEKQLSALQEQRVSESQIAACEIEKLNSRISMLTARLNKLTIRSPIDGMVIAGDLEKSIGTPLEIGQTLFEVGPSEYFDVEVEIPEEKVRFAKSGQPVTLRFPACPLDDWQGKIERIYPKAEIRDDKVVFIASVRLRNSSGLLKPGLQGACWISTGPSVLGWNLFHLPIDRARSWMGI